MERRALIIDDDPQVREILHEIFLSSGYKCELANDGRIPNLLLDDWSV